MDLSRLVVLLTFFLLSYAAYTLGLRRARALATEQAVSLSSRPNYYGYFAVLCVLLPTAIVSALWLAFEPAIIKQAVMQKLSTTAPSKDAVGILYMEIENYARGAIAGQPSAQVAEGLRTFSTLKQNSARAYWGLSISVFILGALYARRRIKPSFRARQSVESVIKLFLLLSSTVAVLTTAGIVFSLIFETLRFFRLVPPQEFLFGTKWSPQIALRSDQTAASGAFGAVPLFTGTAVIAGIAMVTAAPVGLLTAVYLAEYAHRRVRAVAKPLLEVLAGIPTVVYGFFAALTVAPYFVRVGSSIGVSVSPESALAAGIVIGIMIIPFVSSLSDDVINAVPQTLRDASYAVGATKSETIQQVVLPAALPGIVGALLLGVSRAIGETMIVVMAAGLAANLTLNPLENLTTVTVQIVTALTGDQEFDSPKTLSAFALGTTLFCVTLVLNVLALRVVKRYREKYD